GQWRAGEARHVRTQHGSSSVSPAPAIAPVCGYVCSMLGIVIVEMIAVWLVCALGVPGLPAIGWAWSTSVLALGIGCFVINDAIKVAYIRTFERDMIERKNME